MKKIYSVLKISLYSFVLGLLAACSSMAAYTPKADEPHARIRLSSDPGVAFEIQDGSVCPQYKLIARHTVGGELIGNQPGPKIGMPEVDGQVSFKSAEFYLPVGKEVRVSAIHRRNEYGYTKWCSVEGVFTPQNGVDYDLNYALMSEKCGLRFFRLKASTEGKIERVSEPGLTKTHDQCRQPRPN